MTSLAVISILDFFSQSVLACFPPTTQISSRWPRKKCIRKESIQNWQGLGLKKMTIETQYTVAINQDWTHCLTCGRLSHNTKTCQRPHTWKWLRGRDIPGQYLAFFVYR